MWKPKNRIRAICLDSLNLFNHDNVHDDLQAYISKVQATLNDMMAKAHTWHIAESVDMVIIPVKLAGTWALYLTQRATKLQSVIIVTRRLGKVEESNRDAPGADFNFERLIQTLGVSVMAIWLKAMAYTMRDQGAAIILCRLRAEEDIGAIYTVN